MTLDEAIKHAEEVSKKNDDYAKEFYRVSKLETHPDRKCAEDGYVKCKKCADEHRQLAEWLKELKWLRKQTTWISAIQKYPSPKEIEYGVQKHYLIQNEYGDMMVANWDGKGWKQMYHYEYIEDKVVAWMPLPESYKANKEYEVKVITRGKCMMYGKELDEDIFFCKECEAKVESEE